MIDHDTLRECLEIAETRRNERRRFMKLATSGLVAAGGLTALAACGQDNENVNEPPVTPSPSPTAPGSSATANDVAILNLALNLEYLEANYYTFAAFGTGLSSQLQSGTGMQGGVTGGRQVQFADATVASYAREIAADENAHVSFIRTQLGSSAVAQPALNIDGGATGAFTAAARAAGVVGATGTFDPYASDDNWLLGAMLLTDVGVSAYKGAASLINNKVFLEAAAGILAVEAYHSGLLRTLLYSRGVAMPALLVQQGQISNARDSLDGPADLDQPIAPTMVNGQMQSNIVPADANGIVFGRTAAQVHNIAYLTNTRTDRGGFFPNGTNNPNPELRFSGAN